MSNNENEIYIESSNKTESIDIDNSNPLSNSDDPKLIINIIDKPLSKTTQSTPQSPREKKVIASDTSKSAPAGKRQTKGVIKRSATFAANKLKGEEIPDLKGGRYTKAFLRISSRYLLLWVVLTQVVSVLALNIAFKLDDLGVILIDNRGALILILILTFVEFALVAFATSSLWEHIRQGSVRPQFLAQSFISVTVLYAQVYTIASLYSQDIFAIQGTPGLVVGNSMIVQFLYMFYFSTTIMTTVGFGDINPAGPGSMILVVTQELISTLYSVVIFGVGVSNFNSTRSDSRNSVELTNILSNISNIKQKKES